MSHMLLIKSSALGIKRDDEIEAERLFYYYKLIMGINLYKLYHTDLLSKSYTTRIVCIIKPRF